MNIISKIVPEWINVFINRYILNPMRISHKCKVCEIGIPQLIDPNFIELEDFTRIQRYVNLITSEAKLIVKKYSAIGAGCLIVPGAHTPTVGLPQFLSTTHINDIQRGIIINEDCWIGAEAALLSKCNIGRGAVVAARSVVTKDVPPYAVVAGMPAKIIATRFTIEQIINHERALYPPEDRYSEKYIHELFETKFKNLKSIGTSEISDENRKILELNKKKYNIYPFNQ